LKLIFGVF